MLAGIERGLGLAQYEPASIRPPDSWTDGRRRTADEIGALLGPLLLTGAKDLHFSAKIVNRLSKLADAAMIARAMSSWIANTSCISRSNRSDQWLKPSATYEVGAAAVNIGRSLWTADPRSSPECATNGTAETCSELSMGPLI